jgi:hypothetical protein
MGVGESKPKSMKDLGAVGVEGEYYFHPAKIASLDLPSSFIKKRRDVLPIFPHTGILCPGALEWFTILELRFRQMFIENSQVGVLHYSPINQKLALVGTIAKVKERQYMPDGRLFVAVEGKERFFVREIVSDKPYLQGKAVNFADYSEFPANIERIEYEVAYHIRINLQMIQWLYPQRNLTMSAKVIENLPPPVDYSREYSRTFSNIPEEELLRRRSDLVFAIINMLQITPSTKLTLLQNPVLENRMLRVYRLLKTATEFLESEVLKKGLRTAQQLEDMKNLARIVMDDVDRARFQSYLDNPAEDTNDKHEPTNSDHSSQIGSLLNGRENNNPWIQQFVRI